MGPQFDIPGRGVVRRCGSGRLLRPFARPERALRAGIDPSKIQITSQQLPWNLKELVEQGCLFNACSLRQLEMYGQLFPGAEVCVRINPGLGSGHSNRTNVVFNNISLLAKVGNLEQGGVAWRDPSRWRGKWVLSTDL